MLDMESWQHRRESSIADTPHTQSSLKNWSDMIDRVWQSKLKTGLKNRLTLVDTQVSKHTTGSIWIHQHRLRLEKERGGPVRKRGSASEHITTRAKNVAEKHSDLMEEMYREDNSCHPRVGDREIWERGRGGPTKKEIFLDLVPQWISIWP